MGSTAPPVRRRTLNQVLRRRLADPARLRTGMAFLSAVALAYAAVIALLAAGGDRPGDLPPWLTIPEAYYFWWEAVFIAPVIVASGLLATSCVYLLARAAGGTGSFDDTLALVGPAIAACTLLTLIPDLIIGVLLNVGLIDADAWLREVTRPSVTLALVWTYLTMYAVAFLTVFPTVVAVAHRLRGLSAVAIGWAGFLVYQSVMAVFVR